VLLFVSLATDKGTNRGELSPWPQCNAYEVADFGLKKATNICIHKSVRNIGKEARFWCEFAVSKYRVISQECKIARAVSEVLKLATLSVTE